jgi:hypothetical protein
MFPFQQLTEAEMKKIILFIGLVVFLVSCQTSVAQPTSTLTLTKTPVTPTNTPASTLTPIPPIITPSLIPTSTSSYSRALCAEQNLTTEECINVGKHQYDIALSYESPKTPACTGAGYPYYGVETDVTFENDVVVIARKEWGSERSYRIDTNMFFSSYQLSRLTTERYFIFTENGIIIKTKRYGALCLIETMTLVK